MDHGKPKHGIVRRSLVALVAGLGLLAVTWNIFDGVIYFHGAGVARANNPGAFWLMAFFMVLALGAALHWAIWGARGREDNVLP
jgi:hypothetical protein